MPKITKRIVDAAQRKPERYILWDDEIKGFGLLVLPSGVKSYIYSYRTKHGRSRRATVGKHGDWTTQQARDRAEAWRELVRNGGDPLGDKVAAREAATVGSILDAYLESEAFRQKAESTQAIDRGRIEHHLRPLLGREHVETLTRESVRRAMSAIRDGRTKATRKTGKKRGKARVRGGEGTARMAIGLLRAAFNWAVKEGLIASNPAADIELGTSGTRDVILEDAGQYRALFETLDVMERERRIPAPAADAIRVIALTGARRGEMVGLRWRHVDLERGLITLPPAGHKTGRRTGQPRVIGLPALAQAIIARQPAGDPDDLVFRAARGEGRLDLSHQWRRRVKRKGGWRVEGVAVEAGLPEGLGLHGLRHTLGSHMAMEGAEAAQIMTALGHRQLSTTTRYIHWAKNARQTLAEKAAATAIAGMAAAKDGGAAADAEVVRLDRRAAK